MHPSFLSETSQDLTISNLTGHPSLLQSLAVLCFRFTLSSDLKFIPSACLFSKGDGMISHNIYFGQIEL